MSFTHHPMCSTLVVALHRELCDDKWALCGPECFGCGLNPMCTRTKEGLKVLFSLQAELGCRVLSEFQCQGRKCHNSQSCIRSRCGVYVQPHCLEGGYESRGNKSNRTYHRTLLLSVSVCPLLLSQPDPRGRDAGEIEFRALLELHKQSCSGGWQR